MSNVRANSYYDYSGGSNAVLYGVAAPANSMGFRNRIINGDMRIDQRNAGASVTPTTNQYLVDRFQAILTQASKFTAQQNAGSATPPTGFTNYLGITSSSAYSVGASDYFSIRQPIEGLNVADLGWGTASAQAVTLSFRVYSSLTGTHSGSVYNSDGSRSYPFTFTISAANTWETKTVSISGDTSGTWLTTNGVGMRVGWSLGVGSTYSGTAGAWAGAFYIGATGATSVVGTNGATFYITGVQLEAGSVASPFERVDYGRQLIQCQRYAMIFGGTSAYESVGTGWATGTTSTNIWIQVPATMRATPSVSYSGNWQVQNFNNATYSVSSMNMNTGETGTSRIGINAISTGMTANIGYVMRANNDTSARLIFSAEL